MKTYLKFFLALAFIGVSFDLLTTWVGISSFGCYEISPLGFNLFHSIFEYAFVLGVIFLFYKLTSYLARASNSPNVLKIGMILNIPILLFPYYFAIHNVVVIMGV